MTTNVSSGVLPPFSLPIISSTGENDPSWMRWAFKIDTLSGGTTNITLTTVDIKATTALTTATRANTVVVTLENAQLQQNLDIEAAQNSANQAVSQIQTLAASINGVMFRTNNLSDVNNAAIARSNLNVNFFPIYTQFAYPSPYSTKIIPIGRGYQIPTNFAGSIIYADKFGTNDNAFTISYIRSGITTIIGTLGLVHGGNFPITPVIGNATTLQAGDILMIIPPAVSDPTLFNIGIMIATTLV